MTVYYNEIDSNAAAWLRELIIAGEIAPGVVDERDIRDITPNELTEFTQCHFFAGIGVWSHALRKAGWSDNRPVWTGSCPCQPFSTAGSGSGFDDERHLWPHWFHLISECRPSNIFGEQVGSKGGAAWFDLVQTDMEATSYSIGAVNTPSSGFGAPHIRQRIFWYGMADNDIDGTECVTGNIKKTSGVQKIEQSKNNTYVSERGGESIDRRTDQSRDGLPDPQSTTGPVNGFWRNSDWLFGKDGKWRPVESGTFPLVDGASRNMVQNSDPIAPENTSEARTIRLKGYGNSINAVQATEFIKTAMEYPS